MSMNIEVAYLKFRIQLLGLDYSTYYVHKSNAMCFTGNVYSPETRIYTDAVELKETYTSSGISEINTILIKEQPEQMSGMNVNYLTVGLGAIISMLLFVITMQLCKNSQSAKRKKSTEQKGYCSQVGYESSHQIQHAGDGEYNMISLSQQNGQFMQNMDHV